MPARRALPFAVLLLGVGFALAVRDADTAEPLQTATVTRGDIATFDQFEGAVEPEQLVDVTTGVPGTIQSLAPDPRGRTDPKFKDRPIDYGAPVEVGTLLARLDDTKFRLEYEHQKAAVALAEAMVAEAQLEQKIQSEARAKLPTEAPNDYKLERATVAMLKADAQLVLSRADLNHYEHKLRQTEIRSPIKGFVIDVRVNPGQSVLGVPSESLFLVGSEMKHWCVWATVPETKVLRVHAGQQVRFTADAFPGRTFTGAVMLVRPKGWKVKDVVQYTVVISVNDSNGEQLLPYLSTDVWIQTGRKENVLRVPAAALRWRPAGALRRGGAEPPAPQPGSSELVWLKSGDKITPIDVTVGVSDGDLTEITADLPEGATVITAGRPPGASR